MMSRNEVCELVLEKCYRIRCLIPAKKIAHTRYITGAPAGRVLVFARLTSKHLVSPRLVPTGLTHLVTYWNVTSSNAIAKHRECDFFKFGENQYLLINLFPLNLMC
jgi:hypothetical protein